MKSLDDFRFAMFQAETIENPVDATQGTAPRSLGWLSAAGAGRIHMHDLHVVLAIRLNIKPFLYGDATWLPQL
jgi:hypothetical protein